MNGVEKITEKELGKIQEIDYEVQAMSETGDLNRFQQLCTTHGKTTVLGLLYKQFEMKYGGPLRAMSMLRRTPFYDETTF